MVQILRRTLVFALYFGDVAEIDRSATGRRSDGDTADFLNRAKLARRDNRDVPSSGVNLPARGRDVSLSQRLQEGDGRKSISGEPVLGIGEIHAFIQHAHAFYLAHQRDEFQLPLDDVREIIHLPVAVFVAGDGSQQPRRVARDRAR